MELTFIDIAFEAVGCGVINAAPLSMRFFTKIALIPFFRSCFYFYLCRSLNLLFFRALPSGIPQSLR